MADPDVAALAIDDCDICKALHTVIEFGKEGRLTEDTLAELQEEFDFQVEEWARAQRDDREQQADQRATWSY